MFDAWIDLMRQKLVTLDPTAFEISREIDNFSAWVRKHLHYLRDGVVIEDCLTEIERLHNLLERIRTNKIAWNGRSWMPVKEESE